MLHTGLLVSRRGWIWLATLAVCLLVPEPPASAVDAPSRPRRLAPMEVTTPPAPAVHMTGFFPNPSPEVQAVGTPHQRQDSRSSDRDAYLQHATELPLDGDGYRVLGQGMQRYYGTYELVELLQQAGARFSERSGDPRDYFLVGDLSTKRGGTIRTRTGRRVHSSHRNGLDVDVNYVRRTCDRGLEELPEGSIFGHLNNPKCRFHLRRNMELMRDFVRGGPDPDGTLVSVFFVSPAFAKRACRAAGARRTFARRYRGVMSRMKAVSGHQAHFHVRLRCPENSLRCNDARAVRRDPCRGF